VAKLKAKFKNPRKKEGIARYDLENIPMDYWDSANRRLREIDTAENSPEVMWKKIKEVIKTEADKNIPKRCMRKRAGWLSKTAEKIANERRKMKVLGKKEDLKRLNAAFQRQVRRDKELFYNQECKKMEENLTKKEHKGVLPGN